MKYLCVILILTVIAIGCGLVLDAPSRGGFHELNRFVQSPPGQWERSWPLYVEPGGEPALRVILDISEGHLEWTLQDPSGEVQWAGDVVGPCVHRETRVLESHPGTWLMRFRSSGAGTYEFRWKGFSARPAAAGG